MDYEKAYNRVSHTWLKCMELSRFPSNLINFLSRLHEGTTAKVLANNSLSAEFPLHSGIQQGDPLAPLLFNITLQPLINALTSQGVLCHAHTDDTTAVIHTQTECNTLLKLITTYEGESGALLNRGKTTIISHPKAIHLQSPFHHTAKKRYLGVTLHRGGRLSVLPRPNLQHSQYSTQTKDITLQQNEHYQQICQASPALPVGSSQGPPGIQPNG